MLFAFKIFNQFPPAMILITCLYSSHHSQNIISAVITFIYHSLQQPFCTFAAMDILFTKNSIAVAAADLWQAAKAFPVWAFHAPMGAGKTTFISALCKDILNVRDTVSSPTFAIINEYQSPVAGTIYHMDWYRLKGEEEAIAAGVEEALQSGRLCLVEWPDVAPLLLPDDALHIHLSVIDETTRRLTTGV